MNIITQSNKKYLPGLKMMLFSLKLNNAKENITIYLLDTEFDHYQEVIDDAKLLNYEIKFVKVPEEYIKLIEKYQTNEEAIKYFSRLSVYRLFIHFLLPDLDKVLYLDADMIIDGDISNLWNYDLKDNYVGAVQDLFYGEENYFNSGMMLLNLKKIREDFNLKKIISFMKKFEGKKSFDQDLLNDMFKNKVVFFNHAYNCHIPDDRRYNLAYKDVNPKVIYHLTCNKPWFVLEKDDTNKFNIWEKYALLYIKVFKELVVYTVYEENDSNIIRMINSLYKNNCKNRIHLIIIFKNEEHTKKFISLLNFIKISSDNISYMLYSESTMKEIEEVSDRLSFTDAAKSYIPWISMIYNRAVFIDSNLIVDKNLYNLMLLDNTIAFNNNTDVFSINVHSARFIASNKDVSVNSESNKGLSIEEIFRSLYGSKLQKISNPIFELKTDKDTLANYEDFVKSFNYRIKKLTQSNSIGIQIQSEYDRYSYGSQL